MEIWSGMSMKSKFIKSEIIPEFFVLAGWAKWTFPSEMGCLSEVAGSHLATMRRDLNLPENGFYATTSALREESTRPVLRTCQHPESALMYCRPWYLNKPLNFQVLLKQAWARFFAHWVYYYIIAVGYIEEQKCTFHFSHLGIGAREVTFL